MSYLWLWCTLVVDLETNDGSAARPFYMSNSLKNLFNKNNRRQPSITRGKAGRDKLTKAGKTRHRWPSDVGWIDFKVLHLPSIWLHFDPNRYGLPVLFANIILDYLYCIVCSFQFSPLGGARCNDKPFRLITIPFLNAIYFRHHAWNTFKVTTVLNCHIIEGYHVQYLIVI